MRSARPQGSTSQKVYGSRFQVEAVSGHGAMGAVYRAVDLTTDETIALKVLFDREDAACDRFEQEALLLSELKHPAIVRYIAHGVTADGERYLAMEWLEGETLEERLQRGALGLMETVSLARRTVEALALAHRKGVVHRDIKPANLFLPDADLDRVKVLDFGIARRLFDGRRLTTLGSALGTPMYMSPEQARGEADVDARADLFSLGTVLFECLSGQPPFTGETPMAVLAKICLDESVDIADRCPGLPSSVQDVLARLLAKDRAERPADTGQLAAELAVITDDLLALGHQVPVPRPRRHTPALTEHEERVFSAIMVSRPPKPGTRLLDGWGVTQQRDEDRFRRTLSGFGARVERFFDGSLVVSMAGEGSPTDQAIGAARCALAIKEMLPPASLAIATSRTEARGPLPLGGLLDGTARMLAHAEPGRIRIDVPTATLLAARFEIAEGDDCYLLFEKGLREPPRTVLGRTVPCVGRDRELLLLEGLWDEAVAEPVARAVLVTSPAGGGKSRVRHEFVERITNKGSPFELLISSGDSMRSGAPYAMLGSALRHAANVSGMEPIEVQRKRLAKHVTRRLPEQHARRVASFLGEVTGIHFPDDELPALHAARQDPRVMADQTLTAWLDYIEAEVAHQPVLLVMEDLHWGDAPSVRLVDAALRTLREQPLLVAAFARPEIDDRFNGLWADRDLQRVSLPPLTTKACQRIARAVLGDIGEERAAWITERADGNPFFVEELLRATAEAVDTSAAQRQVEALPTTILGMVQARFDALGTEGKRVLRAASIYGQSFRRGALMPLLGEAAIHDLDTWLDVLETREIVTASEAAGTREFNFRHALLREAAYDTLTATDRKNGHKLAGDWLEKAGERDAMVLVEHFERAGEKGKAAQWCRVGAEQALEANDLGAVLLRVDRGVGNEAEGEVLGALRLAEASACNWRGEYQRAASAAATAALLTSGRARYFARREQVVALGRQALYEQTWALVQNFADPQGPDEEEARLAALVEAAQMLTFGGRSTEAARILDAVEAKSPNGSLLAGLLNARAILVREKVDVSLRLFEQAMNGWLRAGDQRSAAVALGNLAVLRGEMGDLETSERLVREAIALTRRLGLDSLVTFNMVNLSQVLLRLKRPNEAREMALQASVLAAAQCERRAESSALGYLAMALIAGGQLEDAEAVARRCLEMVHGVPSRIPWAWAIRAQCAVARGHSSEAAGFVDEARRCLAEAGYLEDAEVYIRLVCAQILADRKKLLEARAILEPAVASIRMQQNSIGDPALKTSFVERIRENSEALALATDWEM